MDAYRLFKAGKLDDADRACMALVASGAHATDARYLRGLIANDRKDFHEACKHFAAVVTERPRVGEFRRSYGLALKRLEKHAEAIEQLEAAVPLLDDRGDAWLSVMLELASSYAALGQPDSALQCLQRVRAARGDVPEAMDQESLVLRAESMAEEARSVLDARIALRSDPAPRLRRILMQPVITSSVEHIDAVRRRFADETQALLAERLPPIDHPDREIGLTPFYLAYHGQNDCPLLTPFGDLVRRVYPTHGAASPPRRGDGRIRIGFVSTSFYAHSVTRVTIGHIRGLPRPEFDVWVFSIAPKQDAHARSVAQSADHYVELPDDLTRICTAIREARLDVLFFADIGMYRTTYFLAYWRLAPLQVMTWAHPVTSGIDSVDVFISHAEAEPPDADSHYREELVRLPGFFMAGYERPGRPVAPDRSRFGLAGGQHVYACPQALFKFHPDFDQALRAILERDASGTIVMIAQHASWTEQLRTRFARTVGAVADRIRFFPPQKHQDFLALVAISDVALDPFHFGGGNSTLESLLLCTPVVTLPAPLLRGRFTLAAYRELQIEECVAADAEEYVEIALRLANEGDFRESIRRQLEERAPTLFERRDPTHALANWLRARLAAQ